MKARENIYTIPAGAAFARTLAKELLREVGEKKEALAGYRILLPTRRAKRTLQEAFLRENGGRPMLLPHLQSLGDVDEEELSLTLFGEDALAIPASIEPMERRIELAAYIGRLPHYENDPARALALAGELGRLIDQIAIEGLDITKLHELVPAEFAEHWQISLAFLKVLTEHWPGILGERGKIDGAERRNRLIRALAESWRKNPPPGPVIAAGSTGSVPATRELLKTIAGLEKGRVILPGLDQAMDRESWDALEETHPQYSLKILLEELNTDRTAIAVFGETGESPRRFLATELMRPAATADAWRHHATSTAARKQAALGVENLGLFVCDNERQEAELIALILRGALEDEKRTAALVTPDRDLARRVAAGLRRWGVRVDDSAGRPLHLTPVGIYLRLCLESCLTRLAPVPLMALLKHDLSTAGLQNASFRKTVDRLEVMTLRGVRPAPGFDGIRSNIKDDSLKSLLNRIEPLMTPLLSLCNGGSRQKFMTLLEMHLTMAEALARSETADGAARLWHGEDGEAASDFLTRLRAHAHAMPDMTPASYAEIFEHLMTEISVRPSYGTHPRLQILGPLEARLVEADLLVLGGLNEGTWPPDSGFDPWMSRPMRKAFGLPGLERKIGLAAHDFEQGFCAPEVILTRSKRRNAAPAAASRWLQRLDAVLTACGASIPARPEQSWAALLDEPQSVESCKRPAPKPPAEIRPRQISVTGVERWLRDPYAVYARYILKLRPLDPLEMEPGHREKGNLLHDTLNEFLERWPENLPADPAAEIMKIAESVRDAEYGGVEPWAFWWPRLARIADWLATHEREWRRTYSPAGHEIEGEMKIKTAGGDFTLTAKADRIDKGKSGGAVIDYKSGGDFSVTSLEKGRLPQLPLEAAILKSGGFEGLAGLEPAEIAYWKLTGAGEPGEIIALSGGLADLVENAETTLRTLIEAFESEGTAYTAQPRPSFAPKYDDYEHLSRLREWSVAGDSEEAA